MVCGTTSDAGKSTVVVGLCRVLARRGVRVAPFKAQNMALNSAVTRSGHEIGRAQYLQAQAAGVEPSVAMNPVLLKPTSERSSQVVVLGRPVGTMSAADYHAYKPELLGTVMDALAELRTRFDVVVCEGAGSPTEINLLDHDIVNLRLAHEGDFDAIVVGDIERGGVFASLYGTVALLPDHLRKRVRGFVINRFIGDPALLGNGMRQLEAASGVPVLGVLPMLGGLELDAEDSLALARAWPTPADPVLDVAVVRLPRISNFTDLDPLAAEPGVAVRLVHSAADLGHPHLIVLPGSKSTVADLVWLRGRGLDRAIPASDAVVLGICGGYQMLGRWIVDEVESSVGRVEALGLLPVQTRFGPDKVLRRGRGAALERGIEGYQIHHGRVEPDDPATGAEEWLSFAGKVDGIRAGRVFGTTVHGLFDADEFRRAFLALVAARAAVELPPSEVRVAERRLTQIDRVADALEEHVDLDRLWEIIEQGARSAR
jgi:adenosylcobyric acid synthase